MGGFTHFLLFIRYNQPNHLKTTNRMNTSIKFLSPIYILIKKLFTPFEVIDKKVLNTVAFLQISVLLYAWFAWVPVKGFFPNLGEVLTAWFQMWHDGLAFHIWQTLKLCGMATVISIIFSCIVAYSSKLPFFEFLANLATKFRYNPIQGFTLFLTIQSGGGRPLQVTILVIFMSFYFITALMSIINDIPPADYDRRKAQGMSRWKILWKVVMLDRFDYLLEVIRQNLSITFMMIVSVEALSKEAGGLGTMLLDTTKGLSFPNIFALQLTIFVIGILLDSGLKYCFRCFPANSKR